MKLIVVMLGTTAVPELGEFDRLIARAAGIPAESVEAVDVVGGEALPEPTAAAGFVLTGSPAMVTERASWSERTAVWLPKVLEAGTPLLGICYGHQLLAHALGGKVGDNTRGREMGTATIDVHAAAAGDPVFGELPPRVYAQESHSQSVITPPRGARVLAGNAHDPHQALAIGPAAWSTQFHPEFDATVMRGYVDVRADALRDEGFDPGSLAATARESPESATVLRRFAAVAGLAVR